jgi:acylglycerol lipase
VLYGHSLGALIALGYVLDGRSRPDLLVLSAPAVEARVPLWQRLLIASLVRVAPGMQIKNRLNTNDLSSDAMVRAKYVSDPLNQHTTTIRFGSAAFAEQRRVAASLDRLSTPTLVVHGGEDRLVPTASSAVFEGMTGVTRRVYPGLPHEIHNEPTGATVVKDIVTWVRERASRLHVSALG